MSRIRTSVPLALLGLLATALGACGSDSDSSDITIPADATPREVIEAAGFQGVHSGVVDTNFVVTKLKENESMSLRLTAGVDRSEEGGSAPFYLAISSQGQWNGRSIDFNSLLVVLANAAVVNLGSGVEQEPYRIGSSTLKNLRLKLSQSQQDGGSSDLSACLQAAQEVNFARLMRDPEGRTGREEADGTEVVLVVGDIEIAGLRDLMVKLADDPACGAQMKALGLPTADQLEAAKVDLSKGIKGAPLTLAVDRHGVIRELSMRFECAELNGNFFELQFDFKLGEVNQAVEVSGAIEGKPLDDLLPKLDTTMAAVLRAAGDEAVIAFLEGLGGAVSGRQPAGA